MRPGAEMPAAGCDNGTGALPIEPFVKLQPFNGQKLPTPIFSNRPCEGSVRLWRGVLKNHAYGVYDEVTAGIACGKCVKLL